MPDQEQKAERSLVLNDQGLVECRTLNDLGRYAKTLLDSGQIPSSFKTPQQVIAAWALGKEVGLKPMQALNSIYVFNGRPGLYAKAQLGIVLSSGLCVGYRDWDEGQGDNLVVYVELKRKNPSGGDPLVKTGRFSWMDAKRARLAGKDTYTGFPRDMLLNRALTRAMSLFNDVLGGMPAVETLQDAERSCPGQFKDVTPPKTPDPLLSAAGIEVVTPRQGEAEGQTAPAPVTTPPAVIDVSPTAERDGRAFIAMVGDQMSITAPAAPPTEDLTPPAGIEAELAATQPPDAYDAGLAAAKPVQPIHPPASAAPVCPKCGNATRKKSGVSKKTGKAYEFWGCEGYPNCKGTVNIG